MNRIEIRRKTMFFRLFLLEKHCTQSLLNSYILSDKTDRKQGRYLLLGLHLPFLRSIQKTSKLGKLTGFIPLYTPL